MKVEQFTLTSADAAVPTFSAGGLARLLIVFAPRPWLTDSNLLANIRAACPPETQIVGCSTAGEITADGAHQDVATLTYLRTERTRVVTRAQTIPTSADSHECGRQLAASLCEGEEAPAYALIFSEGLKLNGDKLVAGLEAGFAGCCGSCSFSGGLAGDGMRVEETVVIANGEVCHQTVVAVAFYGAHFRGASASASGWSPFGSFRKITRSEENRVYEIDSFSALEVYASYLGDDAEHLPSSGLLYPLEVVPPGQSVAVIRTFMEVDRETGMLTFAGDVPQGSTARLMSASNNQLVDGAEAAVRLALQQLEKPDLALLFSCFGRMLVLASHTDLEVDAVRENLPVGTVIAGFHSYGEIGRDETQTAVKLHNQTMTITLLAEDL